MRNGPTVPWESRNVPQKVDANFWGGFRERFFFLLNVSFVPFLGRVRRHRQDQVMRISTTRKQMLRLPTPFGRSPLPPPPPPPPRDAWIMLSRISPLNAMGPEPTSWCLSSIKDSVIDVAYTPCTSNPPNCLIRFIVLLLRVHNITIRITYTYKRCVSRCVRGSGPRTLERRV